MTTRRATNLAVALLGAIFMEAAMAQGIVQWFKELVVPASNATKTITVAQTWEVRWESRHGRYSGDTRPEIEVFLSEKEADDFAVSLRNSFKLVRHSSGTAVKVEKAK